MIGRTLGHYRIVEKIGAGGMAEVYRAHDERLDRDVAVKVLPAGTLTDETARKRFRKEALALSKLNHPNIETVHDFDTQDGVDFLVMEHIPGVTLSEKLATGPLPEKEIAHLGAQMAEGLAAAHKENIIHRDIKPGNIRVTPDGRVKILDFGIAKLLRPVSATATTESFTETHSMAGTLPYMAPEQLREGTADHRSDIHSFGVVLYEMATGRRPFEEKLSSALTDAILHQPPPPPGRLKPALSPRLEEIILKCLEKDPEHRYQSAKESLVDLRRLSAPTAEVSPRRVPGGSARLILRFGSVGLAAAVVLLTVLLVLNVGGLRQRLFGGVEPGQITSLAVLPLENMMGDAEQEYFVEGMHEALITDLSRIRALKVISRTSVMRYKDTDKPIPEIARELGVEAVVEGSVLRVGNQVRITAQLIHAATDEHLWAEAYERDLTNILALQREVARAIAREIRIAVTPEEEVSLASARPVNPQAYEAYVKGRYYLYKETPEDLSKSFESFRQAIEKDPTYTLAYAGLAKAHNFSEAYGGVTPREANTRAKAAAAKALKLDDSLAEAHDILALLLLSVDWDWKGAEREYRHAIELNPGYAPARSGYSYYLAVVGRHDEAIAEQKRAAEVDPLSLYVQVRLAIRFFLARRYDEAIEQSRKVLQMNPDYAPGHVGLGRAYIQKGKFEEGVAELQEAARLGGGDYYDYALAVGYAMAGRRKEALKILNTHKDEWVKITPGSIATIYAALGERDRAFPWLEKAFEMREGSIVQMKVHPLFDPLRSDPRFQSLLRRLNFPE